MFWTIWIYSSTFVSSIVFVMSFQTIAFQALTYKGFWTVVVYPFLNFMNECLFSLFYLLLNMLLLGQVYLLFTSSMLYWYVHSWWLACPCSGILSCSTYLSFFESHKYDSSYEWCCFYQLYSSRSLTYLAFFLVHRLDSLLSSLGKTPPTLNSSIDWIVLAGCIYPWISSILIRLHFLIRFLDAYA